MKKFQLLSVIVLLVGLVTLPGRPACAQFVPSPNGEPNPAIAKTELPVGGTTVTDPKNKQNLFYFYLHEYPSVIPDPKGGFSGFYNSTDAGQTWHLLLYYLQFETLFIKPDNGELFALVQDEQFIKREDGFLTVANYSRAISSKDGRNWKDIMGKNAPIYGLKSITMDPDFPMRVRLHGEGFRGFYLVATDDNYSAWKFVDIPTGPPF